MKVKVNAGEHHLAGRVGRKRGQRDGETGLQVYAGVRD